MSEAILKTLAIIIDRKDITPKYFAKKMWPDSPAWKNSHGCGNGSHKGGGMYQAAGGFLGKLRRTGLIDEYYDGITKIRTLTKKGREFIMLNTPPAKGE